MRIWLTAVIRTPEALALELVPHSDSAWSPWRVAASVLREGAGLMLTFRVEGDLDTLVIPPETASERTDELWRTTCCEWFVTDPHGSGYAEFNFSPSGGWAAYHFDDTRSGMRDLLLDQPPSVSSAKENGWLEVSVALPWAFANHARYGCSAVLEHVDGRRAFHALAHRAGPPNFHARACFTGVLGGKDLA